MKDAVKWFGMGVALGVGVFTLATALFVGLLWIASDVLRW